MRVGYVVHTYPALSHAFIQREVEGLREAGLDVHTLSIHRAGSEHLLAAADHREAERTAWLLPPVLRRIVAAHMRALRHPIAYLRTLAFALRSAPPGARARVWQVFYFAEAICVWAWARRHRLDHLHAHLANVATDTTWLASVYDRAARPPGRWGWSFTMHGPTELFAVERFNLAAKVAAADAVVCISDFCRSQLMLLCPPEAWGKLVVVHCGADLRRYRFRPPPPPGRPDGPLRVLCVGRLVARKGQDVLLDAVRLLNQEGADGSPRVTLTLVGRGPAAGRLAERAESLGVAGAVRFAGAAGQDELPDIVADHDVFCLASFSEGVPVVLMEAMAVGRPVVATTVAGISELVTHGVNGLLVPPGRADLLAGALERLASDPALRTGMGEAGRRAVERGFDSRACAALLAARFTAVGGRPAVRRAPGSAGSRAGAGATEQDLLHDL